MKIFTNYLTKINFTPRSVSFCANPQQPVESTDRINSLSNVQPDYNVRVPIGYKHVEDIKLNDDLSAKVYKLANGQNVVIVPKSGGDTVVKTYVNTGSFNEPDNLRGISHYIEHNLFNGSEALGDKVFFDEVNKMGAGTNASTSFANTDYFISSSLTDDKQLEDEIELHAGMLTSPKFLTEKLEKEKKIVNSEINMYISENESLGFSQTVKNLFNVKSTSLDLVAGNTDNITALTRDDVVEYFNNNYYPANMTTVITGDVNPDKTIKLVAKYFNSTKAPSGKRLNEKLVPIQHPVRQDIISSKSDSDGATLFIGFVGPENNNTKDKIYIQAIYSLLEGLNNSKFSPIEKKYGNSLNIFPERVSSKSSDNSLTMIQSTVNDKDSEMLIKDIYSALDKISKEPISEDELIAIKNKMIKNRDKKFERSYSINSNIGYAFLNNDLDRLKNFNTIVENMTADDIMNTAKKYLDLNKAAITVVHPSNVDEKQIKSNYENSIKGANISFTGSINQKRPIDTDKITSYRTHNNFEVIFNNAPSNTIYFKMDITEPEWTIKKVTIANVLSDMLEYAGTKDKSVEEIAKYSDKYGINSFLFATDKSLEFSGDFPTNSISESMKYIKDRLENPNFTQKEFEASVKRIKDNLKNIEINSDDNFYAQIYEGTPLGVTVKDKIEQLDSITLEDVKKYYNDILNNSKAKIVLTGPFDKNPQLKQEVFDSINTYQKVKPWNVDLQKIYSPIEKTKVLTQVNKKNQAEIIEGFKYPVSGNLKDAVCVSLLDEIFGASSSSRLFSDLREKRHLAYGVSSYNREDGDLGVFALCIETTTENKETGEKTLENLQKSIDGFNENIEKIKTELVSDEELAAAKKRIKANLMSCIETNFDKNNFIFMEKDTFYGIGYMNMLYNLVDSITAEDILATAQNIFNSKPIYSITATEDTLEYNKDFLKNLEG